jgi:predicted ABC-type transport system involved in lysophospholipase L1 biosynthesis ATPase subunit
MVAIMGPSGSGKTTLLNCVSGIDRPDEGTVEIAGETVDYGSERARTAVRRERIGMVFQFFNLVPTLTVRENILLPFMIMRQNGADREARVSTLLAEVGLEARAPLSIPALGRRDAIGLDRARPGPPSGAAAGRRTDRQRQPRDRPVDHEHAAQHRAPRRRRHPARHP